MEMISPLLESILNCCNQAITRFDPGTGVAPSMSEMAILQQLLTLRRLLLPLASRCRTDRNQGHWLNFPEIPSKMAVHTHSR